MADLTRRQALAMGIGAAVVAAVPASVAAAIPVAEAPASDLLAWAVGTPGEFDWQFIRARTADEAIRSFACETVGGDGCEDENADPDGCGDCEWCFAMGADAERKPMWDDLEQTTNADWIRAGMGSLCSRCSYETFPDTGAEIVKEEVVCEECMTLTDWDIVDPERAAELREQAKPRPRAEPASPGSQP